MTSQRSELGRIGACLQLQLQYCKAAACCNVDSCCHTNVLDTGWWVLEMHYKATHLNWFAF